MNNRQWQNYIKNECKNIPFTQVDSGDILYLECENQAITNDNLPIYDQPKYRPVMILDGTELKNHPNLTKNFDEKIDPYAYYCIPLTGTHHDNDPKHKFDVKLDVRQLHYPKSNKQPYARPDTIFKFDSQDIMYLFQHEDDPKLQSSLNNRKIGHIEPEDRNQILNELATQIESENNVLRQRFGDPFYLTPIAKNPTKLNYQIHPDVINPFDQPAMNDPDLRR